MNFEDRDVVVTGGTGALGGAVIASLLETGARCHVPFRDPAEAERFPHQGHARVTLHALGNLADEAEVARFYQSVPSPWASIHLAGGFAMAPVGKTDKAALMGQFEMNLATCFLCCRAAVGVMTRTGAGGRIVNVAARPALEWRAGAGMVAYAASKAAVAALTVALAEEVARDGILVNAVAPSILDTPANRAAMPKADHGSWPKLDEVASTILFLASPSNRVTRGAIVPVYGRT
jgi:NAD(P)-dependent dehydrogenase (short-subunit alcohol dehydrogenase family)